MEQGSGRERFGHPAGLWVLAGTELWDRISFHGMQAILTLYLASELLVGRRPDAVLGMGLYRHALETLTGPLTVSGLATQTFGIYIAAVYTTPIIGGWIGDRLLTRRTSVSLGALLMTLGHFCLAFDVSFLVGLVLLAGGACLLRGNLGTQIKPLYRPGDPRQADAMQLYLLTVNMGAFVAPLITGALAAFWGWHVGFGVAGFGMLVGLVVYQAGQPLLAPEPPRQHPAARPPLTAEDRRRVAGVLAVWPLLVCFWVAQSQVWNTYNLWVRDHIDRDVGGFIVPVPWLQSLDGLLPALMVAPALMLWRWQRARGTEPHLLTKMATGALVLALGTLILAWGSHAPGSDARASLAVPVAFHFVSNIGWLCFGPVSDALVLTRASTRVRGLLYGSTGLAIALGSLVAGRLGSLYETIPAAQFWVIHAAIVGGAGVALLLLSRPLARIMPEAEDAAVADDLAAAAAPAPVPA